MIKHIKVLLTMVLGISLQACELDNYDEPSSALYGRILDAETGETIEQDIMNGSTIQLSEQGYNPVTIQYLPIQYDGNYKSGQLFHATYTVEAGRGNFIAPDSQTIQLSGDTQLDFKVHPYLRLKEVSLTKSGNVVHASFKVEQLTENQVVHVGLYVHSEPNVGAAMNLFKVEQTLNRIVSADEEFSLSFDLSEHTAELDCGKTYYIRIGALSGAVEAKSNYAPAIIMTL